MRRTHHSLREGLTLGFMVATSIWLWLVILWAFTDAVDAADFATLSTLLAVGYMLSRGIAKASRVLEQ